MSEQYKRNHKYVLANLDSTFTVLSNEEATTICGGSSDEPFNAQLADYKAANRELQAMNFKFKKLEGVIGVENRISQAKIG